MMADMSDRQALIRELREEAEAIEGASGSFWNSYKPFAATLRAAATALEEAQGVSVAWMYESERSCVGPFTERRVTFTIDRWGHVPPKYKETPLYAAPAAPTRDEQDARRLTFTLAQVEELVDMFGEDEESEITVQYFAAGAIEPDSPDDPPSEAGLWGYMTEYPEEGARWLGPGLDAALAEPKR